MKELITIFLFLVGIVSFEAGAASSSSSARPSSGGHAGENLETITIINETGRNITLSGIVIYYAKRPGDRSLFHRIRLDPQSIPNDQSSIIDIPKQNEHAHSGISNYSLSYQGFNMYASFNFKIGDSSHIDEATVQLTSSNPTLILTKEGDDYKFTPAPN